jgi:penicillin-binding protein 2
MLPGEKSGLIPTPAWKMAVQGVRWQTGETLISGIGQGFVLSTPLQLAVMTARVANGGFAVRPRLTRKIDAPEKLNLEDIPMAEEPAYLGISDASLAVVREGMNRVSNHKRGTAYASRIRQKGMQMAGKTGTAQVRRISRAERLDRVRKNEEKDWIKRDHGLFVAYAPVDAPQYAISVLIEHGGSGSRVAAPIARDIMHETQKLDPSHRSRGSLETTSDNPANV